MKKFLITFGIVVLIVVLFAFGLAVYESYSPGYREIIDGAVWELNEDCKSYTLINLEEGYAETSYTVPETVDGKRVTAIADDAFLSHFPNLVSIKIPESVTSIGEGAFAGCKSLTTVNIPSGVTVIERSTFSGCTSLESVDLPEGITAIGGVAFSRCESLTTVNIPDGVTVIEDGTFSGCTSLKSVDLPEGITAIGERAFYGCKSLEHITIPDSVTSIGEWAFSHCDLLKTVSIPKNVVSVASNAFPYDTLEGIYFDGTKSAWYKVTGMPVGKRWACGVVCSDGIIEKDE